MERPPGRRSSERAKEWCPGRDLNPDELPHTPLKRTRIPIPPPGQVSPFSGPRGMVPREGLEPTRPCGHWYLKPARLPFRHLGTDPRIDRYRSTARRHVSTSQNRSEGSEDLPQSGSLERVADHDDLVREGQREHVSTLRQLLLERAVGGRSRRLGARARGALTSSASSSGSWTPMTFDPPVSVWLDARSGYRSGSRPRSMSTTAAWNVPVASRSVTNSRGRQRHVGHLEPEGRPVADHRLRCGEEARVGALRRTQDLERRWAAWPSGRCQPSSLCSQPALVRARSPPTGRRARPDRPPASNSGERRRDRTGGTRRGHRVRLVDEPRRGRSPAAGPSGPRVAANSGWVGRRFSRTAVSVAPG